MAPHREGAQPADRLMRHGPHTTVQIGRRAVLAGLASVPFAGAAVAQAYPEHLIRVIVPQGPGGPTDVLARLIAQRLQTALRQNVIVENRVGAGGVIAAKAAAAADPDGHTLFFGNTSTLVIIPALSRSAGYDGTRSFAPIAKLAELSQVLVVNPSLPEIGRASCRERV